MFDGRHKVLVGTELVDTDLATWARFLEEADRSVRQDTVAGWKVSTVFIGLDMGYGDRSLWFETMVFGAGPHGDFQDRYETYEEAYAGHVKVCHDIDPDFVVGPPNHKPRSATADDAEYYNHLIESQEALKSK